jgi:hypothetical protein
MILLVRLAAAVALGLTLIPAVLVALGRLDLETNKSLMLAGTVLWFTAVVVSSKLKRTNP